MPYAVEVRDSWDLRSRELSGPYATVGLADAQAQRIRHHDRALRYSVLVVMLTDTCAADYATEGDHDTSFWDESARYFPTEHEHDLAAERTNDVRDAR